MFGWLLPKQELSESETSRGLHMMLYDAMCGQTMIVLTLGPFMVAFAVMLGASNATIGLIGAIGPLSGLLQIPAVYLVERLGTRKLLTVLPALVQRLSWFAIASIPFWAPPGTAVPVFLAFLVAFFAIGAFAGCAFNSWLRDLVPDEKMGDFFSKRFTVATFAGAAISMAGALSIDYMKEAMGSDSLAYAVIFSVGATAGVAGVFFLGAVPEPKMIPSLHAGFRRLLLEPFHHEAFHKLNIFLAAWVFATNFSGPFFTVYMLRRLELNMTAILAFSVLSQLTNVLFFRIWGRLADRFSNKSVIAVAGPIFVFSLLLWPITTMANGTAVLVLLSLFHILTGMAIAGIGLGANNLTLKTAPRGRATAYLTVSALIQGTAAALAPILAGLAGDGLSRNHLTIDFAWVYTGLEVSEYNAPTLDMHGLDFIILASFVFGLYALHRLLGVQEEGEAAPAVVQQELMNEMERRLRSVSTVAGLRFFMSLPLYAANRLGGAVKKGARTVTKGLLPPSDSA